MRTFPMLCAGLVLAAGSLSAQAVEISPMVGYKWFGAFPLKAEGSTQNSEAELQSSPSYGVSVGFRIEDDGQMAIRWKRQSTDMRLFRPTGLEVLPVPQATLDQLHGEFTLHFRDETAKARPYILAGAGFTRISLNGDARVRFSFGIGAGVKYYFNRWLGMRVEAQLTPILFPGSSRDVWCFQGCYVVPTYRLVNQAEVTAGPVFRF